MREVQPAVAAPPERLFRVARSASPLAFNHIDSLDAELPSFGNRFDVVGGGVMYAAQTRLAAFREALAPFRTSTFLSSEGDENFFDRAAVPPGWRSSRQLITFRLEDPRPFVIVDAPDTLLFLRETFALPVDIDAVRGPDRRVTRAIARWAYLATDDEDNARFGGLRYSSTTSGDDLWAVFEGGTIVVIDAVALSRQDAELEHASDDFGLAIL